MRKNSYIHGLTESQTLAYVLRSIFEGKSEDQIAERFDGDTVLVKTWIDALKQIHYSSYKSLQRASYNTRW